MPRRLPYFALTLVVLAIVWPCAVACAEGEHMEVINTSGGYWSDVGIAIDSHGLPWIAYYNGDNKLVYVMHREIGGWVEETLGPNAVGCGALSVAMDDQDRLHLLTAYSHDRQPGVYPLVYWRRDPNGWYRQDVGIGAVGDENLAVDSQGWPHFAYRPRWQEPLLTYVWQDAEGWHSNTIPGTELELSGVAPIEMTDRDQPIVTVGASGTSPDRVLRLVDGTWILDPSPPATYSGGFETLLRDGQWLQIISFTVMNPVISHAWQTAEGWQQSQVADYGNTPQLIGHLDTVVDSWNSLHIVAPFDSYVRWYRAVETNWSTVTVNFPGMGTPQASDADVDSQGRIHMAARAGNSILYLVLSDYAAPEAKLSAGLAVSPAIFGPGWNLDYTLTITNTGAFDLPDLTAASLVPEGACCPSNGSDTELSAAITTAPTGLAWQIPLLQVGEVLRLTYRLHSLSMVGDGETISNTARISAAYMGDTTVGVEAACDVSLAPTTTPSPTPSAAPTSIVYWSRLPLIWVGDK